MNRQDFEQQCISISDQIWEFAEPRYQEFHSSALQADFLEQEGFTVTRNLGGIATAWGGKRYYVKENSQESPAEP